MSTNVVRRRLGQHVGKPIIEDFPQTARIALCYLLDEINSKGYLVSEKTVIRELNRCGRFTSEDLTGAKSDSYINKISVRINKLDWIQLFTFCERLYERLLTSIEYDFQEVVSLADARLYFTNEINTILDEENIAFYFEDGQFRRRGHVQTQKAISRVGEVLSNPNLVKVKYHFNKALGFYNQRPKPDLENCIKEVLCALEACVEITTLKKASEDFPKALRQLIGNNENNIPGPIAESIIKIHGYRGSGEGVSHGSLGGNLVRMPDVELVLSIAASYITYLSTLFIHEEEIPF
jgi:hypothetical protein